MANEKIMKDFEKFLTGFDKTDIYSSGQRLLDLLDLPEGTQIGRMSLEEFLQNLKKDSLKEDIKSKILDIQFLRQVGTKDLEYYPNSDFKSTIESTNYANYNFVFIKLKAEHYTRSKLSEIARFINKDIPPTQVIFLYGNRLSIAITDRRPNKLDSNRDVLEKITQIKDINLNQPVRWHLEVLSSLCLSQIGIVQTIDELHDKWKTQLSTDGLNRKFYQEVEQWYNRTVKQAIIPLEKASKVLGKDIEEKLKPEAVIRIITRLIFIWFMKEKEGLIPEKFFNKDEVSRYLKEPVGSGTSYYNAILQNLFFGVLNCKTGDRRFAKKDDKNKYDTDANDRGMHNFFRYQAMFAEGQEEKFIQDTKYIPYLNGGLFTCHDKKDKEEQKTNYIIDGFSNNKNNRAVLSDELFFNPDKSGIIDILKKYHFTLEETTPPEQEVALDPELLGQIFENLLASYNPETKTTARKATGSYYTPREIVDYMAKTSLVEALKNKLEGRDIEDLEQKLNDLFDYEKEGNPFDQQTSSLVAGRIKSLKILDPACGSGAFPMGVLNLMLLGLNKLGDGQIPYDDKLDVIKDCIYGVDIQPIATEISKLRFFISLLIDENINKKRDNMGIKPLPNLETKFITANSLISLNMDNKQKELWDIDTYFNHIATIFERYTNADTPSRKSSLKRSFYDNLDEIKRICDTKFKGKNLIFFESEQFINTK